MDKEASLIFEQYKTVLEAIPGSAPGDYQPAQGRQSVRAGDSTELKAGHVNPAAVPKGMEQGRRHTYREFLGRAWPSNIRNDPNRPQHAYIDYDIQIVNEPGGYLEGESDYGPTVEFKKMSVVGGGGEGEGITPETVKKWQDEHQSINAETMPMKWVMARILMHPNAGGKPLPAPFGPELDQAWQAYAAKLPEKQAGTGGQAQYAADWEHMLGKGKGSAEGAPSTGYPSPELPGGAPDPRYP